MNEALVKSFDNMILQQGKMDNKAYIFIGFIAVIFAFLVPNKNSLTAISFYLILISIPFIMSLIPIANKISIILIDFLLNGKRIKNVNIFYYIDLYKLTYDNFINVLENDYNINAISKAETYLIKQILVNAKILKIKVLWHNLSFVLILAYFVYEIVKWIGNII